jgi:hypothetical protein
MPYIKELSAIEIQLTYLTPSTTNSGGGSDGSAVTKNEIALPLPNVIAKIDSWASILE